MSELIDYPKAYRLMDGDPEFFLEIAQILSVQMESRREAIEEAFSGGNAQSCADAIHKLKGSFRNLGALMPAEILGQMELLAEQGKIDQARKLWQEALPLTREFETLVDTGAWRESFMAVAPKSTN